MIDAADVYMASNAVIANYGMGVTQHKHGVETVKMIVNLLLLRGNIGKPGAGSHRFAAIPMFRASAPSASPRRPSLCRSTSSPSSMASSRPRWDGFTTVDACQGILKGDVRGFVSLGGNFLRAVPERSLMEPAWPGCGFRCRSQPSSIAAISSPAK